MYGDEEGGWSTSLAGQTAGRVAKFWSGDQVLEGIVLVVDKVDRCSDKSRRNLKNEKHRTAVATFEGGQCPAGHYDVSDKVYFMLPLHLSCLQNQVFVSLVQLLLQHLQLNLVPLQMQLGGEQLRKYNIFNSYLLKMIKSFCNI